MKVSSLLSLLTPPTVQFPKTAKRTSDPGSSAVRSAADGELRSRSDRRHIRRAGTGALLSDRNRGFSSADNVIVLYPDAPEPAM